MLSLLLVLAATSWKTDLDVLRTELARIHPRFQQCGLTPELNAAFDDVASKASDDAGTVVQVSKLLASVGDGHTILWPFTLQRAPVSLWWFDDGVYVVAARDPKYVGKRVTSIGSLPAEEVLRRLEPYISHDNQMQFRWAAPFYATFPDFLAAAGAASSRSEIALTFADGEQATFAAEAIDPNTLEVRLLPLHPHKELFRFDELPHGIAYVEVTAMRDDAAQTLAAFAQSLRAKLRGKRAAIVDLRLNNGGEASKADELLKTLIAYDVGGGRLAILISRMTFSAAQTFATRADQWTNAIFVGEATGSRPNHYGNERPFKLPASGLRGTISSGFNQPVTARDTRDAIQPDVAVPSRAADYFSSTDRVLEAAIAALESRP